MSVLTKSFLDLVESSNDKDIHLGDLEWEYKTTVMPDELKTYVKAIMVAAEARKSNWLNSVETMFLRLYVKTYKDS